MEGVTVPADGSVHVPDQEHEEEDEEELVAQLRSCVEQQEPGVATHLYTIKYRNQG